MVLRWCWFVMQLYFKLSTIHQHKNKTTTQHHLTISTFFQHEKNKPVGMDTHTIFR